MSNTVRMTFMGLVLFVLPACAAAQSNWSYDSDRDHIGRIYYYERSNIDGSRVEQIAVFRRSATEIDVYKHVARCGNAALVTAQLDLQTLSTSAIIGGRLLPDAQSEQLAFLNWDPATNQLGIRVDLPNLHLEAQTDTAMTPWHLFDYDFGSLTVTTPYVTNPEANFEFGLALVWSDFEVEDVLTWMGQISAEFVRAEDHAGTSAHFYTLTGSGLSPIGPATSQGEQGQLWLDAEDGHIVEARLPVPNHPGYTDFQLRLTGVGDGGLEEWEALLRYHFDGCSPRPSQHSN